MSMHRWLVLLLLITGFSLMKRQNMISSTIPAADQCHVILKKELDGGSDVYFSTVHESPDQEEAVLNRSFTRNFPAPIAGNIVLNTDCSVLHQYAFSGSPHIIRAHHDYIFRLTPF